MPLDGAACSHEHYSMTKWCSKLQLSVRSLLSGLVEMIYLIMEQDAGNKNIKIGFAEIAVAAAIYAFCKSIYLILVYYNTIPHFELMFLKLDVELPAITQTVISLRGSGNALILDCFRCFAWSYFVGEAISRWGNVCIYSCFDVINGALVPHLCSRNVCTVLYYNRTPQRLTLLHHNNPLRHIHFNLHF